MVKIQKIYRYIAIGKFSSHSLFPVPQFLSPRKTTDTCLVYLSRDQDPEGNEGHRLLRAKEGAFILLP